MRGEQPKIYYNPTDRHIHLDLVVLDDAREAERTVLALEDKQVTVDLKKWSEKRTLSANAYYWVLVNKLAKTMSASKSRMHNILLRRYGVVIASDQYAMVPETEEAFEETLESETLHLKPTSSVVTGKNGRDYRLYMFLLGSSQMDADEMGTLIDGTVDECKQVGIETMTPREIEELIEREKERR
ncbi:MAG: hypothetical protein IJ091_11255 [Oscillospiraceae bacterium]|nr:hypothetical protein [Oscillospiraceae bacterium]MBQ8996376.1 hypothetical protein [Oscillospiraceae bacterium]